MPTTFKSITIKFISTPIDDWDELPFPSDTKKCFIDGQPTSLKDGIHEFATIMIDEFCKQELPSGCVITAVTSIDEGDGEKVVSMFEPPSPENDPIK